MQILFKKSIFTKIKVYERNIRVFFFLTYIPTFFIICIFFYNYLIKDKEEFILLSLFIL